MTINLMVKLGLMVLIIAICVALSSAQLCGSRRGRRLLAFDQATLQCLTLYDKSGCLVCRNFPYGGQQICVHFVCSGHGTPTDQSQCHCTVPTDESVRACKNTTAAGKAATQSRIAERNRQKSDTQNMKSQQTQHAKELTKEHNLQADIKKLKQQNLLLKNKNKLAKAKAEQQRAQQQLKLSDARVTSSAKQVRADRHAANVASNRVAKDEKLSQQADIIRNKYARRAIRAAVKNGTCSGSHCFQSASKQASQLHLHSHSHLAPK